MRLQSENWLGDAKCRIADRLGISLGQRDLLTPPAGVFKDPDRNDGSHDLREFVTIGESTVAWLIEEGLEPGDAVLEVGCGIGRMAIPLLRHLGTGSYVGVEIDPRKVAYCRATVGKLAANFTFEHADVFNRYYNPTGTLRGRDYAFPFEPERFDFVFLISVFTHMLPEDVEHYLAQIARAMAPGAVCVSSFLLSPAPIGPPMHQFSDVCEILDLEEPEHGVVYLEEYVTECFADNGLRIDRLFHRGDSDGNRDRPQDLVVAHKP
jgi:SAM-dependent methyltransferase